VDVRVEHSLTCRFTTIYAHVNPLRTEFVLDYVFDLLHQITNTPTSLTARCSAVWELTGDASE